MRSWIVCCVLAAWVGLACGSDGPNAPGDDPNNPNNPNNPGGSGGPINGSFTAVVDGTAFNASIIIPAMSSGASAIGASSSSLTIAFAWLDQGVGTYTIGQSIGMNANLTLVATGSPQWIAAATMGSGTLNITTRTTNRVAGTFNFSMVPSPGGTATGTRNVTNGAFDVTF
jgi:hypothetical protein